MAVISDDSHPFKKGVVSPLMFAHVAIIDPQLTVGLPAPITAATGIDAFVHALEAFTGLHTNPLSDVLALESLRLAHGNLERATDDGSDIEARRNMMLAAIYGGIAMDQAGLGLVHALSGGICSHLHLHHGLANAMILPFAADFNAGYIAPDRQARLNEVLGLPTEAPDTALVETLTDLVGSLGLPVGLTDRRDETADVDWEAVARESMQMVMIRNNPRPVSIDDCRGDPRIDALTGQRSTAPTRSMTSAAVAMVSSRESAVENRHRELGEPVTAAPVGDGGGTLRGGAVHHEREHPLVLHQPRRMIEALGHRGSDGLGVCTAQTDGFLHRRRGVDEPICHVAPEPLEGGVVGDDRRRIRDLDRILDPGPRCRARGRPALRESLRGCDRARPHRRSLAPVASNPGPRPATQISISGTP